MRRLHATSSTKARMQTPASTLRVRSGRSDEGTAAASQERACRLRFAESRDGVVLSRQAHTLGVYRNRNTRRREDSGCRRVAAMTPDPALVERARVIVADCTHTSFAKVDPVDIHGACAACIA